MSLQKLDPSLDREGPLLLVIADGFGCAPDVGSNAIAQADTPVLDELLSSELSTELLAHGLAVGLPTNGDMGNSEVGHNALGAGRIFAQGAKLVNKAIEDRSIYQSAAWQSVVAAGEGATVHFLGLHSDGNVHSHTDHLYALLKEAAAIGIKDVVVHILHDGRDVAVRSALGLSLIHI